MKFTHVINWVKRQLPEGRVTDEDLKHFSAKSNRKLTSPLSLRLHQKYRSQGCRDPKGTYVEPKKGAKLGIKGANLEASKKN